MQLNLTLICFVFGGFLPDAAARREQMDTGQCDLPRSVSRAGPGWGRAGPRGMRACPRGARGPRGAGGTGARGRIPPTPLRARGRAWPPQVWRRCPACAPRRGPGRVPRGSRGVTAGPSPTRASWCPWALLAASPRGASARRGGSGTPAPPALRAALRVSSLSPSFVPLHH